MHKAMLALDIKALDDDARIIEGWATTPDVDRVGDVVMPKGAKFDLPMPFLLDHEHDKVVGEVDSVEVSDKGIKFRAHIKKVDEPGPLKDMLDMAWQLVKTGLRKAVSIGFRPLDFEPLPNGGLKFTSWDWYELSAVGIPAQPSARITATKTYSLEDQFVTESACPENILGIDGDTSRPFDDFAIPTPPEPAASGKEVRVVRLNEAPAPGQYVIEKIIHT